MLLICIRTMDIVLLEALPGCKVDVATYFIDLNEAFHLAPLLCLLVQFIRKAFRNTLRNAFRVVECPALQPISLSNIITAVAARQLRSFGSIATGSKEMTHCSFT